MTKSTEFPMDVFVITNDPQLVEASSYLYTGKQPNTKHLHNGNYAHAVFRTEATGIDSSGILGVFSRECVGKRLISPEEWLALCDKHRPAAFQPGDKVIMKRPKGETYHISEAYLKSMPDSQVIDKVNITSVNLVGHTWQFPITWFRKATTGEKS